MKKIITFLGWILIIAGCSSLIALNKDEIYKYYLNNLDPERQNITISINYDYSSLPLIDNLEITDDFIAKNNNHIFNIFYTIINSGNSTFTFFCDPDYKECIKDVEALIKDESKLEVINDMVHPYNSFKKVKLEYTTDGKITVIIEKNYSENEITEINNKVKEIIESNITTTMNNRDKIKVIHDYIIKHTKYDEQRADNKTSNYESYKAYGVLIQNYGICSGYSDSMAIFLNQLNIKNYKISNKTHVWNYVNLDNKWYHLDLTWDDPVTTNGKNVLKYYYFLIDNAKLDKLNTGSHGYDKKIYAK